MNSTLTSKSQLTVPKAVREDMGAEPGDKIEFVPAWRGYKLVLVKGDVSRIRGIFKGRRKQALSIEEMNRSITQMGSRAEPIQSARREPRR